MKLQAVTRNESQVAGQRVSVVHSNDSRPSGQTVRQDEEQLPTQPIVWGQIIYLIKSLTPTLDTEYLSDLAPGLTL